MPRRDTLAAASGRWPQILADLGGIRPEQLCRREGPCPNCGGSTRFRWDQDDGNGAWHCSHCGGKDGAGGGGTGIDLLMRVRAWTFAEASARVDLHLSRERPAAGPARKRSRGAAFVPPPKRQPPQAPSERVAFLWLEEAGQVAEGEHFSPPHAQGRAYTSRWLRWSGDNIDLAEAIVLEFDTTAGLDRLPPDEPPPPAPVEPVAAIRASLAAALHRGDTRADLEALIARLSAEHEQSAGTVRAMLRALEQEERSAQMIATGRQRLEIAADRAEIGGELITLAGLFPSSIAEAIRTRMQFLPADDISSALTFLAGAAGVMKLGSEVIAKASAGFRVPLNLYVALVGRSGAKKGPGTRLLLDEQIDPIVRDLAQQHARNMASWREENHGRKASERSEPPLELRIRASKWTGESLDAALANLETAGLGLLISREELAGMFGGLNQYRGGRGDDSEQLLEAYDGRGAVALRITADGGGRFYSQCQVTICGAIQPLVLKRLVSASAGDASGLWARFVFAPLPERVVAIPPEESPEQIQASEAAAAMLAHTIGLLYRLPRQSLHLSYEARRDFLAYEARCQGDALRAELPAQSACWGKAAGKALRIAGLLHLLHRVCPDGRHSEEIQPWAIREACNLTDHLTGWTLGLHAAASDEEDPTELMRTLHRVAGLEGSVGWRELRGRLSKRQREAIDSGAARAAAAALAGLGYGEVLTGARGGWTYRVLKDLPG